jgi:hypothetical protein
MLMVTDKKKTAKSELRKLSREENCRRLRRSRRKRT